MEYWPSDPSLHHSNTPVIDPWALAERGNQAYKFCGHLSGFVIFDDVLCETPAQNFRSSFGDANATDLAIPPFER
jgi:hypothetical protein